MNSFTYTLIIISFSFLNSHSRNVLRNTHTSRRKERVREEHLLFSILTYYFIVRQIYYKCILVPFLWLLVHIQCRAFVSDLPLMTWAFWHTVAFWTNAFPEIKLELWLSFLVEKRNSQRMEQRDFFPTFFEWLHCPPHARTHQFNFDCNQCKCDFHHKQNNWWLTIKASFFPSRSDLSAGITAFTHEYASKYSVVELSLFLLFWCLK